MSNFYDLSYTQIRIDNSIHYTHDVSGVVTLNMHPVIGQYIGFFYTIIAYGGFYIQQQFPTIKYTGEVPVPTPDTFTIKKYDVTNALQIIFDVNIINQKLGVFILKENKFANTSITLSAKEFISNISASQIISLGLFNNLYRNFIHYVNNYFSYGSDFLSLFSSNNELFYKNAEFDVNSFIELINSYSLDDSGRFVPQITGSITLNGLNDLLKYLNKTNVFGNRTDGLMEKGFIEGDLILIPDGITITLNLNMDFTTTIPRNEIYKIKQSFKDKDNRCNKNKHEKDNHNKNNKNLPFQSLSNIQRTFTAPLMLKLQKL